MKIPSLGSDGKLLGQFVPARLSEPALSGTFVRFRDTEGNPIPDSLVTITVDTATGEIADITFEEIA